MLDILLTRLRDKTTTRRDFRQAVDQVSLYLAMETARHLPRRETRISSPICETDGFALEQPMMVLPILRAGLSMLPAFMRIFEETSVGFIGVRRNEKTAIPSKYYEKIPELTGTEQIIILDPTLATGGSAVMAIQACIEHGALEEQISVVNIFAAPEGIEHIRHEHPNVALVTGNIDDGLNSHKYIVPGVGDFGDRFCG